MNSVDFAFYRLRPDDHIGIFPLLVDMAGSDEGFHRRFGYDVQRSGPITSGNGEYLPCASVGSYITILGKTTLSVLCELDLVCVM